MITSFSSAEAQDYRRSLSDWLGANVPRSWLEHRNRMSDEENVALRRDWDLRLYQAGYAGLTWPERFGGQGLGPIEEYLFYEESARHHAPEGFGRIGRLLVGPTLIEHGTDQQRSRFLSGILTGEEVWCQGFSEPGAGSDLAAVSTRAVADGDRLVVSGHKTWNSFAQHADWCILLARTGAADARHHNLTMLIVDMRDPGVSVRPIKQIGGSSEFNEVFIDNVVVPRDRIIGEVNDGWRIAMTVLTNERGAVEGANRYIALLEDVDLLRRCLPESSARVAHYRALVEALRWQIMRAIEGQAAGGPDWFGRMAVLKLYWSELWQEITETGLTVGNEDFEDVWRAHYLTARAATIYSGTSQIQRNVIAERVLGLPRAR